MQTGCSSPCFGSGKKGEGRFEPVSWDEAIDRIAGALACDSRGPRGRSHPSVPLRRLERFLDRRARRPRFLRGHRRFAAREDDLRRPDGRGGAGHVREDARSRLPRLRRGALHLDLGREPPGVEHPSRSLPERGEAPGGVHRARRPDPHPLERSRRPAPSRLSGGRPAPRARHHRLPRADGRHRS